MEEIKVQTLYDFRQVAVPEKLLELPVSQKALEERLADAAERFLTIEPAADAIRPGDFVAAALAGEEGGPRHVNVGKGFSGRDLEAGLVGMRRGEMRELVIDGAPCPVQVLSVKRRIVPPLTDELVCRLGIENVSTVEQYRADSLQKLREQAQRSKANALFTLVSREVLARSVFAGGGPESEEFVALRAAYNSWLERMAARAKTPLEEFAAKAFRIKAGTAEQCGRSLDELCESQLKLGAVSRFYAERDGVTFTREALMQQIRQASKGQGEQDELEIAAAQNYGSYFRQQVAAFYQDKYRLTMTD